MQRAAAGLAYAVLDLLGSAYGRRVLLLVGSGDNGGDALYAGALLARRGVQVEAWLLSRPRRTRAALAALRAAGGRSSPTTRATPDLVVDGIVGIGGRPGLRHDARARAASAASGVPVVAVDTPSGVDVDTGELDGPHVTADVTVTFGTHKVAHLVDPAAARVRRRAPRRHRPRPAAGRGRGAPARGRRARCCRGRRRTRRSTPAAWSASAPAARSTPAPRCSASPAPTAGLCGMVRYVGGGGRPGPGSVHPEVVGEGRVQAWVVGSGGGERAGDELRRRLARRRTARHRRRRPAARRRPCRADAVLTPHAGELAAMTGADRADIEARPLHHAPARPPSATAAWSCSRAGTRWSPRPTAGSASTTTGTPWLATAGAGDVLGGLIGALLAAGLDAVRRRLGRLLAARCRGDPRRRGRPARRGRGRRVHPGRPCGACPTR